MASSRLVPWIIAGGVGESPVSPITPPSSLVLCVRIRDRVNAKYVISSLVGIAGGVYIFRPSFQELSGTSPAPETIKDGRSQSVKEDRHNDGYILPPYLTFSHPHLQPLP